MALIIGSYAARKNGILNRTPADIDMWLTANEFETVCDWFGNNGIRKYTISPLRSHNKFIIRVPQRSIANYEIGIYDNGSPEHLIIMAQAHSQVARLFGINMPLASPRTLIGIKRSHLNYPVNWDKHVADYHNMRASVPPSSACSEDPILLKEGLHGLQQAAKQRFEKRQRGRPNLNMSNDEFFSKSSAAVGRVWEHDDIHEAVKFGSRPLFTYLKNDQAKAACDKSLWNVLPLAAQVKTVQEEAMVIALERQLIPGTDMSLEESYQWAVKRISTTLTSGWFRDFAIEHWPAIKQLPESHVRFDEKFFNAVESGKVRRLGA